MNMNRMINMAVRLLMNKAINRGIDMAAGRGKPPEEMTPQEREQAKAARGTARNARRNLGFLRRFMR